MVVTIDISYMVVSNDIAVDDSNGSTNGSTNGSSLQMIDNLIIAICSYYQW